MIQSSDLIIHSEFPMEENPFMNNGLVSRVNQLIGTGYMQKSHVLDSDKFFIAKKMEEAGIRIPKTMTADEYLAESDEPMVFKPRMGAKGEVVLYLHRPTIEYFLGKRGPRIPILNWPRPINPDDVMLQEFIETPGDRFTSYRIFTVGDEILGGVLVASRYTKGEFETGAKKNRWLYQRVPKIHGTYPITSNVAVGGFRLSYFQDITVA